MKNQSINIKSIFIALACMITLLLAGDCSAQKQFPHINPGFESVQDSTAFANESEASLAICKIIAKRGLQIPMEQIKIAKHWFKMQGEEILEKAVDKKIEAIQMNQFLDNKKMIQWGFMQVASGSWCISYYFKSSVNNNDEINVIINDKGKLVQLNHYQFTKEYEYISKYVFGDISLVSEK